MGWTGLASRVMYHTTLSDPLGCHPEYGNRSMRRLMRLRLVSSSSDSTPVCVLVINITTLGKIGGLFIECIYPKANWSTDRSG